MKRVAKGSFRVPDAFASFSVLLFICGKECDMATNQELLASIIRRLNNLTYISPHSIPGIELYMDQVTTFMDERLENNKRYPEDKILTKTMINNYTKNRLLPPPNHKKYSKEHMLLLIFIYYAKNFLSFSDIQTLMEPLTRAHFAPGKDAGLQLEKIYNEVIALDKASIAGLKAEIIDKYKKAENSFSSAREEEREYLVLFGFVCELAFDIYIKKQTIEYIADYLKKKQDTEKKK